MNAGDCFASAQILELVAGDIRIHSGYDVLYGHGVFEYDSGYRWINIVPDQVTKEYLYADSLNHQGMFYMRELFDRFGGYSTSYKIASDWLFAIVLCHAGIRFKNLDYLCACSDPNGISNANQSLSLNERGEIIADWYSDIEIAQYRQNAAKNQQNNQESLLGYLRQNVKMRMLNIERVS
jgi:hypothetical protein